MSISRYTESLPVAPFSPTKFSPTLNTIEEEEDENNPNQLIIQIAERITLLADKKLSPPPRNIETKTPPAPPPTPITE